MRGWMFRIAIIAVIAGGAYIFRDRLSGSAGDLTVGDCFDVPANDTNIKDVQHHPCNESHTGEIFAVLTSPAAKGAPPPTRDELISFLGTQCGAVFTQVHRHRRQCPGRSRLRRVLSQRQGLGKRRPRRDVLHVPGRRGSDGRLRQEVTLGAVGHRPRSPGSVPIPWPGAIPRSSPTNGIPCRSTASRLIRNAAVFASATSRT